jgi:hypothetical protein
MDPLKRHPGEFRKGYWRMSSNSIVQRALNVQWLKDQSVISLVDLWVAYKYPP